MKSETLIDEKIHIYAKIINWLQKTKTKLKDITKQDVLNALRCHNNQEEDDEYEEKY